MKSYDEKRRSLLRLALASGVAPLLAPVARAAESGSTPARGTETGALPAGSTPLEPEIRDHMKSWTAYNTVLTPAGKHGVNYHGKVQPWKLSEQELAEIRLTKETYALEIYSGDADKSAVSLEKPRTLAAKNPVTHAELVALMEKNPVRILKSLMCTNAAKPYGHALWEGVPLRDVLWLANPRGAVRRLVFSAKDPKEESKVQWQASMSAARIFEDPPGLPPVIVALKMNGEWLPSMYGGPARIIIPEAYGTKNVKYLDKVILNNSLEVKGDAEMTNDLESPFKTCAVELDIRKGATFAADKPFVLGGLALAGMSGLGGVQVAVLPQEQAPSAGGKKGAVEPPADDPWLDKLPWQDARILPPPSNMSSQIPGGLKGVYGFDAGTGRPSEWPLPFFNCYFACVIRGLKPGNYVAFYRAVDRRGEAQPRPRRYNPLDSGVNDQYLRPASFVVT